MTEPEGKVFRPRQLVLHVTETTYDAVSLEAHQRAISKSAVLREIFNAGLKARVDARSDH